MAAVLLAMFGGLGFLYAFLLMSAVSDSSDHGQSVSAVLYVLIYVQFALSAAQVICGVLVWQGRNWARVLAIVLCSINILGAVVSLFSGAVFQAIAAIGVNAAMLRLLSGYEVQVWCSR
ncbi:hypothetical protein [Actinoplanes sp. NPDC026670]|uniref:hypothetical protein n=1 Tax=Actinoplanes sp. NPDC026670 TaxID=3154700 RepID=UPI003403FABC